MLTTPSVYLDSTIFAGFADPIHAVTSQRLMEDFQSGKYKPIISTLVQAETADVSDDVFDIYAEILKTHPKVVDFSEKADTLAELYLERQILKETEYFDALHVALATLEEVDILTSWDHPNILHFSKVRGFIQVNIELGLKPIQIRCPRLVASHE